MEYDNTNKGVLFVNDGKDTNNPDDKKPDMTGKLNVDGAEFRIAAWKKVATNSGKAFLSLSINLADNLKSEDDGMPF
tara:strand:- start:280 stop:510 length:231 start_codon:yes stop_codon:yes gene_type:complete